jgi:hypothetical protein
MNDVTDFRINRLGFGFDSCPVRQSIQRLSLHVKLWGFASTSPSSFANCRDFPASSLRPYGRRSLLQLRRCRLLGAVRTRGRWFPNGQSRPDADIHGSGLMTAAVPPKRPRLPATIYSALNNRFASRIRRSSRR